MNQRLIQARVMQNLTHRFSRINHFISQEKGSPFLETSFRHRRMMVILQAGLNGIEGYSIPLTG
jgi:hypothetical protein